MSLATVRQGLVDRLHTITGLHAYGVWPEQVNPPAALIELDRVEVHTTFSGRGTYFLPEVDDEVLVVAEAGDPAHLFVVGALWNGKAAPPSDNDDGKNNERLIHSRSGHRLRFVDDTSAPEIDLELKDGARIRLDKDGVLVDAGNGNSVSVGASGTVEIKAAQKLDLHAPSVTIHADASLEVKASGTLTLKGATVQIN